MFRWRELDQADEVKKAALRRADGCWQHFRDGSGLRHRE
jgi:hypothetical protein